MEAEMIRIGDIVNIILNEKASSDFQQQVAKLHGVSGRVEDISGIGICTVVLQPGVSIPGYSHPLGDCSGREYIDLSQVHLQIP